MGGSSGGPVRRIAVVGCSDGRLPVALAIASPADVVAGFDPDRVTVALARRRAALAGVADRVTFEVADPLLGANYDLIYLTVPQRTAATQRRRTTMTAIALNREALPAERSDQYESRAGQLGPYTVDFGSMKAGLTMDATTFAGLPDDACQCPHWGVLIAGEWRVPMSDGTVATVRAGEAYYLPPGHHFEVVADCEYIEFSPTEELQSTYAVVAGNQPATTA